MYKTFGETIASLRRAHGMRQQTLADALAEAGVPVSNQAVSKWENDATLPNAQQFLTLCRVLDVDDIAGTFSGGDAGGVQTSPPLAANAVRNNIMVDIIDILFSMYDMHEGIDNALHFIGNTLRVDKILIFKYSPDGKSASIAHEWCSDPKWRSGERFQNVPVEAVKLPQTRDFSGIYIAAIFRKSSRKGKRSSSTAPSPRSSNATSCATGA